MARFTDLIAMTLSAIYDYLHTTFASFCIKFSTERNREEGRLHPLLHYAIFKYKAIGSHTKLLLLTLLFCCVSLKAINKTYKECNFSHFYIELLN